MEACHLFGDWIMVFKKKNHCVCLFVCSFSFNRTFFLFQFCFITLSLFQSLVSVVVFKMFYLDIWASTELPVSEKLVEFPN